MAYIARVETVGADMVEAVPLLFGCPLYICDGSGEVEEAQYDSDSNRYYHTGDTRSCPCTL